MYLYLSGQIFGGCCFCFCFVLGFFVFFFLGGGGGGCLLGGFRRKKGLELFGLKQTTIHRFCLFAYLLPSYVILSRNVLFACNALSSARLKNGMLVMFCCFYFSCPAFRLAFGGRVRLISLRLLVYFTKYGAIKGQANTSLFCKPFVMATFVFAIFHPQRQCLRRHCATIMA